MRYKIGRLLQLLGLVLLTVAIAGNLAGEKLDLKESLTLSGLGMLIFLAGWLVQQGSRPR